MNPYLLDTPSGCKTSCGPPVLVLVPDRVHPDRARCHHILLTIIDETAVRRIAPQPLGSKDHDGVPWECNPPFSAEFVLMAGCRVTQHSDAVACLLDTLGECEDRFIEWLAGDVAPPLGEQCPARRRRVRYELGGNTSPEFIGSNLAHH